MKYERKSLLFLSKKPSKLQEMVKDFCIDHEYILTVVEGISSTLESVYFNKYDTLIIEYGNFPEDILCLFNKNILFVNKVFYVTTKCNTTLENLLVFNPNDTDKLICELENFLKQPSKLFSGVNSTIKRTITNELNMLGLSPKYDGFTYIVDIICNYYLIGRTPISFSKSVYPSLSKCYNKKPSAIEKDIRHMLKKDWDTNEILINNLKPFTPDNFNPTTRNIFNLIIIYLKNKKIKFNTL